MGNLNECISIHSLPEPTASRIRTAAAKYKTAKTGSRRSIERAILEEINRLEGKEGTAAPEHKAVTAMREDVKKSISRLPTEEQEKVSAEVEQVEADDARARVLRKVAKQFNKEVVFFKGDYARGAVVPRVKDTILINENQKADALFVLGHELLHTLKMEYPKLYRQLGKEIAGGAKGYQKYADDYRKQVPGAKDAEIVEELLADFSGEQFTDPAFLRSIKNSNPTLFDRIAEILMKLFNTLGEVSGVHFARVRDAQAALAEVMGEYTESEKKKADAYKRGISPRVINQTVIRLPEKVQAEMKEYIAKLPKGAGHGLMLNSEGSLVFDPQEAALGIKYSITTPGKGGRFLRGAEAKTGPMAQDVVVTDLDKSVIQDFDGTNTVKQAAAASRKIKRLNPVVTTVEKKLRYKGTPEGYYGNNKMRFPNDAYPQGRNSWDIPGCGRLLWATTNKVERDTPCYGGACYAESLKIVRHGKDAGVTRGVNKDPVRSKHREEVLDYFRENGVDETRQKYPQYEIIVYDKFTAAERREVEKVGIENKRNFFMEDGQLKKVSVGRFKTAAGDVVSFDTLGNFVPLAAVVSTNLQNARGQDIRLGVDTDGSAWLTNTEVMDAMLAADPRSLSIFSSAYHTPPQPHPVAGRTMINVTVSGWHPLPETLARLRWAEETRANGWNVILREVVADPAVFGEEMADIYNRLHDALMKTDFFIMQQALHIKKKVGDKEQFGLPGCCKGSKKNPGTCDACEVSEGLGKRFIDYWDIPKYAAKEDKILPDVKKNITDKTIAAAKRAIDKKTKFSVAGYNVPQDLIDDLSSVHEGVDAYLSIDNKGIILSELQMPKELRNGGLGTEFMNKLIRYADENKLKTGLTVAGDFGGTKSGQRRFYKRFGFVENRGRNKDYSFSENMIREPVVVPKQYKDLPVKFKRTEQVKKIEEDMGINYNGVMETSAAMKAKGFNDLYLFTDPQTGSTLSVDDLDTVAEKLDEMRQKFSTKFSRAAAVDTPALRKWFGDSKIVDEKGDPLVVYHGTSSGGFNVFEKGVGDEFFGGNKKRPGISFHFDEEFANVYAEEKEPVSENNVPQREIIPVYLRAEKPWDYENHEHLSIAQGALAQHPEYEGWMEAELKDGDWEIVESRVVQKAIRKAGFDSFYSNDHPGKAINVFNSTQIKSATGNIGTFDPEDPDIRYSRISNVAHRKIAPGEYPQSLEKVYKHTNVSKLKKHPEYNAAKREKDPLAAVRVVNDIVDQNTINQIKDQLAPDRPVYVIPVIHREGKSLNMLPIAYADYIADQMDGEVWLEIGKTQGTANTDATVKQRSLNRQLFEGDPPPTGSQFIIVDDTFTTGDTLTALIDRVFHKDRMPIIASALTSGRYQNWLMPTDDKIKSMLDKAEISEVDFKNEFGYSPNKLTGSEIQQYILNGGRGIKGLQARLSPERSEVGARIDEKLQERTEESVKFSRSKTPKTISKKFQTTTYDSPVTAATSAFSGALDHIKENGITSGVDWLRTQMVDRYNPIKKELGEQIYKLHKLLNNSAATTGTFLQHGKMKWDNGAISIDTKNEGFVPWLKSLGEEGRYFLHWVAAKRSQQLYQEGRENWITPEEADAIIEEATGGSRATETKFEKYAKKLQEYNSNVLDIAEGAGLIDPESRKVWEQHYYVPFYRILENEQTGEDFLKAPVNTKKFLSAGIKKLKGGESLLGDPMVNLLHNWSHLINQSQLNMARQAAGQLMLDIGLADQMKKSDLSKVVGVVNRFDVKDSNGNIDDTFSKKSEADAYAEAIGGTVHSFTSINRKAIEDAQIISYQENGKPVYIKPQDPDLFSALSHANTKMLDNWLMMLLRGSKRLLTAGATFSAGFRIANMLRDTIHTAIVSKNFIPVVDTARGLMQVWQKSDDYIRLMASGGGFSQGYLDSGDPKALARSIKKLIKSEGPNVRNIIIDTAKKGLALWERVGHTSEMAARVQLYTNLRKDGKTHMESAYEARDLLDFVSSGQSDVVRTAIAVIPFLNARAQGLDRLARGAIANPAAFAVKGLLVSAASLTLWAMYKDDDRYKDLENFDKWQYHHFWIGDTHYRIPKAFEVGAIFATTFETIANTMTEDEDFQFFLDMALHTMTQTFALGVPTGLSAPAELWANKSFFTGREIESQWMRKLPEEMRYRPWTPEALKIAGKTLGVSPVKLETLVRGYTATFGTMFLSMVDMALSFDSHSVRPRESFTEFTGLNRFRRTRPENVKQATRFYKFTEEAEKVYNAIKVYQDTNDIVSVKRMLKNHPDYATRKQLASNINSQLSIVRQREKYIWNNKTMKPAEKKRQLDLIKLRKNEIYKKAYEDIRKLK